MESTQLNTDTICAIATPQGVGGIAVIRVSGANAIGVVQSVWKGKSLNDVTSHTSHLGYIVNPEDGSLIDQAVCTIFRAPASFTGENVVEISVHGSIWIQQQVVKILIENGCRLAMAGEFTRRAFVNGKIDLSQAEAVADLIASNSAASHRVALNQLRGDFKHMLQSLRQSLVEFASLLELELDFSEEDVEFANRKQLLNLATDIKHKVSVLCKSFAQGNVIKNGIPVAIVGETNVGKSTLLNALLRDDKAIVSDINGTTRDVIEDTMTIGGLMFRFIDTAGIRDTDDTIERMGIDKTLKKIAQSQIIFWVIDLATPKAKILETGKSIFPLNAGQKLFVLLNKSDIHSDDTINSMADFIGETMHTDTTKPIVMPISAKEKGGIEQLEKALINISAGIEADSDQTIVTNIRHYEALMMTLEAIERVIDGLKNNLSGDFISQDIREATHYIGEITGEITTDTLLQTIFSRFCIGK